MKYQTVTENKGKLTLATVTFLPAVSAFAEGPITAEQITSSISGLGMAALVGAAVVAMLGIAVLIWGGKKIIGFFGR